VFPVVGFVELHGVRCLMCSIGLFAGPEGPMVHIGAIVGASVSRFYTEVVLSGARDWTTFNTLKNVSSTSTRR
jgi:H+/Cl- antiporter ClcA